MRLGKSPVTLALATCIVATTALAAGPATQLRSFDPDDPTTPRSQPVLAGSTIATFSVAAVDDAGNPVPGAGVTFSVPAFSTCGSFSSQSSAQVTADATGRATSPPFTASAQSGDCAVVASLPGRLPMIFDAPIFSAGELMIVTRAMSIDVLTNTDFSVSLGLQVQLASGATYAIPNTPVTIDVENSVSGANASIAGGNALMTDAQGGANVVLHGNGSSGSYSVVMHVLGSNVSTPVVQGSQGSGMRLQFVNAVTNVVSGQPFDIAVDAFSLSGSPVAGVQLRLDYECYEFLICVSFDDEFATVATTDNNGRAHFTGVGGRYSGAYGVRAGVVIGSTFHAHADVKQVDADPRRFKRYQDMWWAGPAENGWGMSVLQQGLDLFIVIFAYDSQGKPTWFVLPSGSWNAAGTAWSGALYHPHGSWWFGYDASKFVAGASVGTATLTFSAGADSAQLDYTIDGQSGTKAVVRQPFGASTGASGSIGGMWWGGQSQNGWGLAILEQTPKIFPILYTYDETGSPTWYVAPDGIWSDLNWRFQGNLYSTTGSPWVGRTYDPSLLRATVFGTFTFDIESGSSATLSIFSGTRGTSTGIVREPF